MTGYVVGKEEAAVEPGFPTSCEEAGNAGPPRTSSKSASGDVNPLTNKGSLKYDRQKIKIDR